MILESSVSRVNSVSKSVVFDRVVGKELAPCPFLKRVSFSPAKPFPNCWNLCSLDSGHCDFGGVRLKFEGFGIDSLRVVWVCPKVKDLSFLERV